MIKLNIGFLIYIIVLSIIYIICFMLIFAKRVRIKVASYSQENYPKRCPLCNSDELYEENPLTSEFTYGCVYCDDCGWILPYAHPRVFKEKEKEV